MPAPTPIVFRREPTRRSFLATAVAAGGAASLTRAEADPAARTAAPPFRISLAQWSLHETIFAGTLDNLDFPRAAKQQFGIEAVEYVNQFFKDKAKDADYIAELARRAEDELCLLVQVETREGLDNLEAIARLDGIDGVFIASPA